MRKPPLDGIVVLDLSRVLAGPLATMLLADLGARVIKVEDPRGGDVSRVWKPPVLDGEATYYLSVNRRKESAAVDLGTPDGQEFVRRWATKADVLVENFLPGALERRGIGVEALRALNPRLVACSISGAGDVGPQAGEPGFDLLAQGATGLMSITGPADGAPHKVGVAVVDVLAGWAALAEILAALHARDARRNRIACEDEPRVDGPRGARQRGRLGPRDRAGGDSPRQLARDDRAVPHVRGLGRGLPARGRHGPAVRGPVRNGAGPERPRADPRFSTNAARVVNRKDLVPVLAAVFAAEPRDSVAWTVQAAGIPAGPIAGVLEALTFTAGRRRSDRPRDGTGGRTVPTVRPPFFLPDFDEPAPAAPPRLGEDTERLFAEVGLPASR